MSSCGLARIEKRVITPDGLKVSCVSFRDTSVAGVVVIDLTFAENQKYDPPHASHRACIQLYHSVPKHRGLLLSHDSHNLVHVDSTCACACLYGDEKHCVGHGVCVLNLLCLF